ncbi:La protein like protein [Habropoda laboriosa]|uniref:La protein like protein n=1 Tax=Habropoda laboriosa TaxID=597456 RepID=A0A0L7QYN8_9HYME|nr:PREDICTED: la protein homolog [Habropoda laboriosa]KOC63739.1 La protein like protein [Habropoda laboriosa]
MENGQEEIKVEPVTNDAAIDEVKNEKPVCKVEESAAKETSKEPSSELLEKIKNQVEFYFGDVNMQRDKFLIEQTKLDNGWVPMSVMLNFKMLTSISKDIDVILKAIESSEFMEISEDKKKIRRSPNHPLPVYNEEYRKAQEARTAYIKGFPLKDINIEKLKAFFSAYEPFENIIMRKYQDKDKKLQFKGSIFVQFKTLEDAKAFMARESVKYGDTELIKKWSADYSLEKAKEKEDRRQKRSEMKAKKSESAKEKNDESGEDDESEKDSSLPKGCVIHFTDAPEKCTREDIKERLGELDASIAFVDFKIGDKEGWIRLQGENSAKAVVDKMKDSKVLICDKEVTCRILEGEEEEKYLAKAKEEMTNVRQKYTKGKKGKKGRNAQRGQRKRRNSESNDSVSAKKPTVD